MKLSTQIWLAFSLVLALSAVDSATNYLLSLKVEKNSEFLTRSQDIIRNSGKLHKTMIQMQSAYRGFLLTNDNHFRDTYKNGLSDLPQLFAEQSQLILGNEKEMSLQDSIFALQEQWIAYTAGLMRTREIRDSSIGTNKSYRALFEEVFKDSIENRLSEEISLKFNAFNKTEYGLRELHSKNLAESIRMTHWTSLILCVLTLLTGLLSVTYISRLITARIRIMVEFAKDISQGKWTTLIDEREDELTRLSESLNVMSKRLEKNFQDLQKHNDELDKYAYVVSHDLKAPIRGIRNVLEWIEEDMGDDIKPELKKYLDLIPQRTRRMEDLINGLLAYARIRESFAVEKVDVNEMLTAIANSIVPRSFEVRIGEMPVLNTERLKLEQVFSNLISNAVKYAKPGGGSISITAKEREKDYLFTVRDDGIGIEEEYHIKIFEMFQTLREKHDEESTGIGLAIIKKILEDRQCTIKVVSTLGKGSDFMFNWTKER